MIHIGVFTDLFHPRIEGGGEVRLHHLTEQYVKQGHEVTILTTSVPGYPRSETLDNGVHVFRIGPSHPSNDTSVVVSFLYLAAGIWHLSKFKRMHFDLVESNTYFPCYLASVLSKAANIPHVMTIHDTYLSDWSFRLHPFLVPFAFLLEKALRFLKPDRVVTVSSNSKKKIIQLLGFEDRIITIIHNGVPSQIRPETDANKKRARVMFLGRLIPHKHVNHLIIAFKDASAKDRSLELLIVGDGAERPSLELLVQELGLADRVTLTGYLKSHEEVYTLLRQSAVLVNPSTVEGFGIVALEGMAAGVPVIVYDIPAYRDFIQAGENAIVIKPYDLQGLADGILAIAGDKEIARNLSIRGIETARRYTWSSISDEMQNLYIEVIKESRLRD